MWMGAPSPGRDMISTTENAPLVSAADVYIKQRSPGRGCTIPPCRRVESKHRVEWDLCSLPFPFDNDAFAVRTSAASIADVEQDAVDRNYRQGYSGNVEAADLFKLAFQMTGS
jgi:hypothetical protein